MPKTDYDAVAGRYAEHIAGELVGKPMDRTWLDAFASRWAGRGLVADVGCGPGHVAAYLAGRGAEVLGLDISAGMVAEARRLHPALRFEPADMLDLEAQPGRFAAAVAFYSLIHFDDATLARALDALRTALIPAGELLAAVHLAEPGGESWLRPSVMWDVPVSLAFRMFQDGELEAAVGAAGFAIGEVAIRNPYSDVEHPTRRLYLRAEA